MNRFDELTIDQQRTLQQINQKLLVDLNAAYVRCRALLRTNGLIDIAPAITGWVDAAIDTGHGVDRELAEVECKNRPHPMPRRVLDLNSHAAITYRPMVYRHGQVIIDRPDRDHSASYILTASSRQRILYLLNECYWTRTVVEPLAVQVTTQR